MDEGGDLQRDFEEHEREQLVVQARLFREVTAVERLRYLREGCRSMLRLRAASAVPDRARLQADRVRDAVSEAMAEALDGPAS